MWPVIVFRAPGETSGGLPAALCLEQFHGTRLDLETARTAERREQVKILLQNFLRAMRAIDETCGLAISR